MGRVGLVALSIAFATIMLVAASYGADWIGPYFENISSPWALIGFVALFPAAAVLLRHRRAHHQIKR